MDYKYQYSDHIALDWVIKNLPQFLFPDLSRKRDRIQKLFSGVVATLDNRPVGLILSTFGASKANARIHSFLIHPEHRQRGVGSRLLQELQDHLVKEGCRQIDGTFRSHWKSVPALKALLTKHGWSEPVKDLVIVRGETKNVLRLFMDDRLSLPPGFAFIPFTEIGDEQRARIKRKKKDENWYPDILNPFTFEQTINPLTSLALTYEGDVVGWVISHLIAKDLNEFTSLFIDDELRSYKLAHLLMRETINRQHDNNIPNFVITSKSDNYVMSRFLIRHAPHTGVFFTTTYRTEKQIG